jgi:hypothetical protein
MVRDWQEPTLQEEEKQTEEIWTCTGIQRVQDRLCGRGDNGEKVTPLTTRKLLQWAGPGLSA